MPSIEGNFLDMKNGIRGTGNLIISLVRILFFSDILR